VAFRNNNSLLIHLDSELRPKDHPSLLHPDTDQQSLESGDESDNVDTSDVDSSDANSQSHARPSEATKTIIDDALLTNAFIGSHLDIPSLWSATPFVLSSSVSVNDRSLYDIPSDTMLK
jgi:hypothetical protein